MKVRLPREPWTFWIGASLIGLGVLLFLGEIFNLHVGGFVWPFFIILPGLSFFYFMVKGGKDAGAFAIPGSIITGTGLLLLYQSITSHWESWAYAWALIFPTSLGVGLFISGQWSKNPSLRRIGVWLINAGIIILIVGGIFFEMLIGISPHQRRSFWPVLIIAFGVYLIVRQFGTLAFRRFSIQRPETPQFEQVSEIQEVSPIIDDLDESPSSNNEEE